MNGNSLIRLLPFCRQVVFRRFRAINAPRLSRSACHRRAFRPKVGSFSLLPLSRLLLPTCGLLLPLSLAQGQHTSHAAATRHKQVDADREIGRQGDRERNADVAPDEEADDGTEGTQSTIGNRQSTIPSTLNSQLSTLNLKCGSAILIDAVSGQVLYEKNADQPRPMASTTKIMTALLLLASGFPMRTHPLPPARLPRVRGKARCT